MPVRIVRDEDLENEDNHNKNKSNGQSNEEEDAKVSFGENYVDPEEIRDLLEEIIGDEVDDNWLSIIAFVTPSLAVAAADGKISEEEMFFLADMGLYGGLGEEEYESMTEEEWEEEVEGFSETLYDIVNNFDSETDYGNLKTALLNLALQLGEEVQESHDFIKYMLNGVISADGKTNRYTSEAFLSICESFKYDAEEIKNLSTEEETEEE